MQPVFQAFPKVVRTGRATEISIYPYGPNPGFQDGINYTATHYPSEEIDNNVWNWPGKPLPARVQDGALVVSGSFDGEQRHLIVIKEVRSGDEKLIGEFPIYSLEDDLFRLYPYRGDFHMHSNESDGLEPPAYVAAMCRKIGLDFMAVTDHGQYQPSLDAQRAYRDTDIDLAIFPGEEVHPPGNPIHIVNFGGKFSLNDLFKDLAQYQREVEAIRASLDGNLEFVDPYMYASSVWCFNKIRLAGGLGIFCHPYWFANRMYRIPESLVMALFATRPFDAVEALGGYRRHETDSNVLQIARYAAEIANGNQLPIVGVSDAHGCHRDLFGWYSTLIFSPSTQFESILDSIKNYRSLAVETLPGSPLHVYGPFRLVKYGLFILNEVMPGHDALCEEEGDWMLAYLAGVGQAGERLAAARGNTQRYLERCFGRSN